MKKAVFIFLSLFLAALLTHAQDDASFQDADSSGSEQQDTITSETEEGYNEIIYSALPDSLHVTKKKFSREKIDELNADPDLNYKVAPTLAESLWDRFLRWLGGIIETILKGAVGTNWGRLIVYVIGLTLLVIVIMMLLKVNAFKVLYSGAGAAQKYQVLEENIHEMDFDILIREAKEQQDYKRAVRLVFLYALKLLSDKDLIHWQSGKTNHDYVAELDHKELKTGFNDLSFYFEYAWYGNFNISPETFNRIQTSFSDWKNKIS